MRSTVRRTARLAVALVQDRPVLGGNKSSEVRVWLQGARNKEPWPRVGNVVAELEQDTSHRRDSTSCCFVEFHKPIVVPVELLKLSARAEKLARADFAITVGIHTAKPTGLLPVPRCEACRLRDE